MQQRATRRRWWLSTTAVAAVAVALLVGVARIAVADTLLFGDDFEDGNSNGWSKSGGSWSVVADGSKVLRQTSGTTGDARAYAGSAWTDTTAQVRVRAERRTASVIRAARAPSAKVGRPGTSSPRTRRETSATKASKLSW